jgi:hypothetical protein
MKPIKSTYEILAWKYLNKDVDEKWSEWAIEMMMVGYDTEHLVELAGIEKPFNQFELKDLTDKVFEELNLDYSNQEIVIKNFVLYLGEQVLSEKKDLLNTLEVLKDICIELDYEETIYDFYSLYFAKDDLETSEVQWYWNGADKSNIDQICFDYFKDWINKNNR